MSLESAGNALYYLLTNDAAVTAIVGSRVRPQSAAADDSYPYIVYEKVSAPTTRTKDGNSNWYQVRFQLSMLCITNSQMLDLSAKVKTALDNQSGTIASQTVQMIALADERDFFNDNSLNDGVWMIQQDYFVTITT